MTAYYTLLMALSVVSNGTIGVVFYKKPQLLTVSNNFVLNLACCDIGLSILVLPFAAAATVLGEWPLSTAWCRIESYLLVVLAVAMHYSLLAISLDRNYAIINSLRYPYIFTHRLGNSIIGATWALGFALGLPPLLGWGSFRYDTQQFICSIEWGVNSRYPVVLLILVIVIPALVQAWCYLSIFRAALGHTKRSTKVYPSTTITTTTATTTTTSSTATVDTVTGTTSSSDSYDSSLPTQNVRSIRSTECKAVKTILLIGAAYFLCWTLFVVAACLRYNHIPVSTTINTSAVTLVFLSCVLNPLIYAFMNRATRYEIWRFWGRIFQQLSGQSSLPFVDGDNPASSTWTTTLSSGRQSSGLWATPSLRAQRGSSRSLAGGGARNVEMITIKEESEIEEELGHHAAASMTSDLAVVPASSTTVTSPDALRTAVVKSSMSTRIKHSSEDPGVIVLNPMELNEELHSKKADTSPFDTQCYEHH
ncbi:G-protein coupled receptor 161-like [Pomacea canaliculata]|uniref:G-protein coupled receptor 161-like n=1 Tax=Pomacea canaliculata TaxID=400727 RepID=UPI000D73FDF4|nr:G-protein coupled receptor 161-like [Pomacea canaliculata]